MEKYILKSTLILLVNFNFATFSSNVQCFNKTGLGWPLGRTWSCLVAVVEVDGMLFFGRLMVGTAPGLSLLQVGTKPKQIQKTDITLQVLILRLNFIHHTGLSILLLSYISLTYEYNVLLYLVLVFKHIMIYLMLVSQVHNHYLSF